MYPYSRLENRNNLSNNATPRRIRFCPNTIGLLDVTRDDDIYPQQRINGGIIDIIDFSTATQQERPRDYCEAAPYCTTSYRTDVNPATNLAHIAQSSGVSNIAMTSVIFPSPAHESNARLACDTGCGIEVNVAGNRLQPSVNRQFSPSDRASALPSSSNNRIVRTTQLTHHQPINRAHQPSRS